MPYHSASEVPDYVPKSKKRQWMAVWNSAYSSALEDGKSKDGAEASAFAQANGVAGPKAAKKADMIPDYVPEDQIGQWASTWDGAYEDALKKGKEDDIAQVHAYGVAWDMFSKALSTNDQIQPWGTETTTMRFNKFMPLVKVDSVNHTVTGLITTEAPDKTGEICDYHTSKPYYQEWSQEFAKTTGGVSLGNLREMHSLTAVGKFTDLLFDDDGKKISGTAKVVDNNAWNKCVEGVYTGFSHGGEYVGGLKKEGKYSRYTAKPSEVSLVDNPCNPDAHFEFVKSDGTVELRKFVATEMPKAVVAADENPEVSKGVSMDTRGASSVQPDGKCPECGEEHGKCKCTKAKGAARLEEKDMSGVCPHCGEEEGKCKCDVEKMYPLDNAFSIRAAWNYMHQTNKATQYSSEQVSVIKAKIAGAWKSKINQEGPPSAEKMALAVTNILAKAVADRHQLSSEQTEKVFGLSMEKGMTNLSRMAQLLLDTAWLKWSVDQEQQAEGDSDSPLPDSLQKQISDMAATLVDMANEETKELVANAKDSKPPDESSLGTMNSPVSSLFRAMEPDEDDLFKAMSDDEVMELFKVGDHSVFAPIDNDEITLFKVNPDIDSGYGGYAHAQPCMCLCDACRAGDCRDCKGIELADMEARGQEVAPGTLPVHQTSM